MDGLYEFMLLGSTIIIQLLIGFVMCLSISNINFANIKSGSGFFSRWAQVQTKQKFADELLILP